MKKLLYLLVIFFLLAFPCFAESSTFITITSPQDGSYVTNTVTIEAQLTQVPQVRSVKFYIDNQLVGQDFDSPYQYLWDTTTNYSDGQHQIYASILQTPEHVPDQANPPLLNSPVVNVTVDNSPPTTPLVTDDGQYTNSINTLHASWTESSDPNSGILGYQYSIGTSLGSTDIINWIAIGNATEVTLTNLNLIHGKTYYFNVRSINGAGLFSNIASSDGITVNANIPQITRIIPANNSTLYVGSQVTIEVSAQDLDSDPLEYQFLIDSQVRQPWSTSNTFDWTVEPSTSDTHLITIQVRDDKGGLVSEDITYNIQTAPIDTTPPSAPIITTVATSNSLDSISASWSSEDPESGIIEYQYAIGTTPGGTDIVYWTSYGNNTQAFISGLNLTEGESYYLSVVAVNGAGLKSAVTTSPTITAQKEPYVKIYYPYQNALVEDREVKVKGIAEGVSQITVNGKPVAVNPDGAFEGPTLVAPGYAKRQNITSSDPNYIIMNFPGETTITASGGGEEDTVLFYFTQLQLKDRWEQEFITYNFITGQTESGSAQVHESWNYNSLSIAPFGDWEDESRNYRLIYSGIVAYYAEYYTLPLEYTVQKTNARYWEYKEDGTIVLLYDTIVTGKTDSFIHTPPAVKGEIKPLVLILFDCTFLETYPGTKDPPPFNLELYKVNGQPLKKLYGDLSSPGPFDTNACYVVLTDYEPDSDLQLKVEAPYYPERIEQQEDRGSIGQQWFRCNKIDALRLDTVREVPYGSGNYVPVNTIPIFQPDDGKGRGPSLELVNMPFLKLKFNEEPSLSQINTLQANLTIAEDARTYDLTETAVDSNIFVDPANEVTIKFDSLPSLNPNIQDELTCFITSIFGNIQNKIFNLKESASDSLYFKDIKTFVTITFNNELLSYQKDTLTILYENGLMASEETLTETSTDSLVFTNEDNSLTLKLNNYQGALTDTLDVTIPNQNQLELSNPTLILLRTKSNPLAYSNYPRGGSSDLPPNDPNDTGQGIFRLRVKGLPKGLSSDILDELDITVEGGIQERTLAILGQPDGSYMTEELILLPEGIQATYPGIVCLNSIDSLEVWQARMVEYLVVLEKRLKRKSALIAASAYPFLKKSTKGALNHIYNTFGGKHGDKHLGYVTSIDSALTKEELDKELPKRSVLYIEGHGVVDENDTFVGFALWKDDNLDSKIILKPEDVNGRDYKLVFLDGCLTADKKTFLPDEFQVAFNTKAYMGWKTETDTMAYAQQFFLKLDEKNWNKEPNTIEDAYYELKEVYFGTVVVEVKKEGEKPYKILYKLHGSDVGKIVSENISIDLLP